MTALDLSSFDPATLAVYGALAILSVLALTVTFYKFFQFSHLGVGQSGDAEAILDDWLSGRPAEAMRAASERDTVLERVLQAVFSGLQARPDDKAYATELGRQTALIEMGMIQLRMRILETVVQAAPMLGLLGTVIGMINAFSTLASAGWRHLYCAHNNSPWPCDCTGDLCGRQLAGKSDRGRAPKHRNMCLNGHPRAR
jgi:biopolymer transport protein ExbB